MLSPEEKLLVDRYLDNTLTGIELRDFLNRLESDERFKKEVSFHNKLIEGISEAEDMRLIQYVFDATGYRKRLIPLSLKLILTFLFITGSGIFLWEYIGPGSTGVKHNYFKWNVKEKDKLQPEISEKVIQESVQGLKKEKEVAAIEAQRDEKKSEADTLSSRDIYVKKDQLIISYNLQPIELSTESATSSSSSFPVEKVDPEAGLPDKKTKSYEVEFWASPVNYKGYKLQGEKLILFGIEVPDEVQLYSINEKLWIKYGNDFYEIQTNSNFESLIQANAIPTELK